MTLKEMISGIVSHGFWPVSANRRPDFSGRIFDRNLAVAEREQIAAADLDALAASSVPVKIHSETPRSSVTKCRV